MLGSWAIGSDRTAGLRQGVGYGCAAGCIRDALGVCRLLGSCGLVGGSEREKKQEEKNRTHTDKLGEELTSVNLNTNSIENVKVIAAIQWALELLYSPPFLTR